MGSSLAAGVKRLVGLAPDLDAIVILLPDQPAVDAGLLGRIFAALKLPETSIVLCDHGRASGPPALFSARHFGELTALEGDAGAKSVAARHAQQVVKVLAPETVHDMDSPEAWESFIQARATS
jgi:molybdenum cofactor cytidylyltransferase